MKVETRLTPAKTVVIVGGGFSGAIFGLKLHRKCPDWRIVIAEPRKNLGRGIAYGACGPEHMLNVPVSRMEIGLKPSFAEWLQPRRSSIAEALVESGLDLASAFVPRRLFGDYVEERVNEALDSKSPVGLSSVRGEVVRLLNDQRGVLLTDGRQIVADVVVLAMGNLPPRPPGGPDTWVYDSGFFHSRPMGLGRLRRHRCGRTGPSNRQRAHCRRRRPAPDPTRSPRTAACDLPSRFDTTHPCLGWRMA